MTARQAISTGEPSPRSDDRFGPAQTAEYIEELLVELEAMAGKSGLARLQAFLSAARAEAAERSREG